MYQTHCNFEHVNFKSFIFAILLVESIIVSFNELGKGTKNHFLDIHLMKHEFVFISDCDVRTVATYDTDKIILMVD